MISGFFTDDSNDVLQSLAIPGLFNWFGASYRDRFGFKTKSNFEAGGKPENYSSLKSAWAVVKI